MPKKGRTLAILMYYGLSLDSIHVLLQEFMPYWSIEYTKAVTLHCAKVGGGKDQGPRVSRPILG